MKPIKASCKTFSFAQFLLKLKVQSSKLKGHPSMEFVYNFLLPLSFQLSAFSSSFLRLESSCSLYKIEHFAKVSVDLGGSCEVGPIIRQEVRSSP
jgi:hypothetical protein